MLTLCVIVFSGRKKKRGHVIKGQKPNIIFVMADDLDVVLGSPEVMVKTKKLLRDEGVTFKNTFTTSPLCCPSRSSILTGRYAHNHHVNTNNQNCSGPSWIDGPEKQTFGKLMQEAGYRTGYFGKYLNNYNGERVPPGWDHWHGLIRNSKYYNYMVNVNSKILRHRGDYKKDYSTKIFTKASIDFFKQHKGNRNVVSKPLFMVLSLAAPHGPEDSAPQYQDRFLNITAPRSPNYNYTSLDKHWIIRKTPPLTALLANFTDALHRKRLQTLLSVDDAIERLYKMLSKTGQLDNTYLMFTSDHGYHLGQFNQVKGKAQPYEADIRIPFYIRGPNIPKGVEVAEIALNIDFLPTFLDIAHAKPPKYVDGTSVMDIAVGGVINRRKRKILKPIWKDTFLVERGKMKTNTVAKRSDPVERLVFPSERKINKMCSSRHYPKPPCTSEKKFTCHAKNGSWYLQSCAVDKSRPSTSCYCTVQISDSVNTENSKPEVDETSMLLMALEKQFERLKRRIKRHGIRGLGKNSKDKTSQNEQRNSTSSVSISKGSGKENALNRKIARGLRKIDIWRRERLRISRNRAMKRKLSESLTKTVRKVAQNSTRVCRCEKKASKKPSRKRRGRDMNCFFFDKNHWKVPPLWTGPSFTACTNSPNSSYWCLRTLNSTHDFLYCEFVTGFKEYFNITADPFQLRNVASLLKKGELDQLHTKLAYMKSCQGSRGCFLRASESLIDRKVTLKKLKRYERKKRHGILVRESKF